MTDPLIRGTLNALILKSLSWGAMHGYAIAKWVQKQTSDVLHVEEGVLYPALHRMEKNGMLRADWGKNDTGRRAKFYSLTPAGRDFNRGKTEINNCRGLTAHIVHRQ